MCFLIRFGVFWVVSTYFQMFSNTSRKSCIKLTPMAEAIRMTVVPITRLIPMRVVSISGIFGKTVVRIASASLPVLAIGTTGV